MAPVGKQENVQGIKLWKDHFERNGDSDCHLEAILRLEQAVP